MLTKGGTPVLLLLGGGGKGSAFLPFFDRKGMGRLCCFRNSMQSFGAGKGKIQASRKSS